jgi:phosphoglycolate phosphatase-like HAD superfamily hydrolase
VKLLLFDIDGTLVLTGGAGRRALNRAFCQVVGIVNALDGMRLNGKTDPAIVREVFAARAGSTGGFESLDHILAAYVEFLLQEVEQSPHYKILPGVLAFLHEFHGCADLAIGLATGNVERGARIKLSRGGLNPFFAFGGFGSDAENRTELVRRAAENGMRHVGAAIDPGDTFVIGDTPRDIDAGREAGFQTVGVATSDFSTDDLHAAGADVVLSDFERDRETFLRTIGIL